MKNVAKYLAIAIALHHKEIPNHLEKINTFYFYFTFY